MPASQTVDAFKDKGLLIDIEPISQEPTVYFTDQSPRFRLIIRNRTEFNFVEGSSIRWVIAIGSGMPSPIYSEAIDIEVPAGEEREYEIGGKLLAFEGHGVIGVSAGGALGSGDPNYELRERRAQSYDAVYTFSVWDRSQYESLHETPKKLQRASLYLTGAVVFFALIQIVLAFFLAIVQVFIALL